MWNLIYEEIRKRTGKVSYNLTKEPDIIFETDDGRTIAFEIEGVIVSLKNDRKEFEYADMRKTENF